MYERLLDKSKMPDEAAIRVCLGQQSYKRLAAFEESLKAGYQPQRELKFPFGNNYGWGYKYSHKGVRLCYAFFEAGAFTVMFQIGDKQVPLLESRLPSLLSKTQELWEHRYPCGERGGWLHYRILSNDELDDVLQLLAIKKKPREEQKDISIRLITQNKKDFLPLLLLGDEQETMIDKYLEYGELFALYDGDVKSMCVVTDEGGGTLEIQNIATDKRYQRQGYASRLLDYVAGYYAGRYNKIILGTGDVPGILTFYARCGFFVTHRVPDFFTTHYDQPIVEDGVLLKDKVYLERKLRPEEAL